MNRPESTLPARGLSTGVPPLPSLALSARPASWLGVGATLYIGLVATVLGYTIWAPFALLIPFVAAYASSLAFGERFGALRLAGMALVLLGLAVIVAPGVVGVTGQARRSR